MALPFLVSPGTMPILTFDLITSAQEREGKHSSNAAPSAPVLQVGASLDLPPPVPGTC